MDAQDTYKIQQRYYYDFSFFPIRGLKKRNNFMFKAYKGHARSLHRVFDSILNSEVLDTNCIVSIRTRMIKTSIPLTESVMTSLQGSLQAVTRLSPVMDRTYLLFVLRTISTLQRAIKNYHEVQLKLANELKKLLSNDRFTVQYKTNSEDINHVTNMLQQLNREMRVCEETFAGFNDQQPHTTVNAGDIKQARRHVTNLVTGLRKLLQVQELIMLQMRSWKKIRLVHEQQQVLN